MSETKNTPATQPTGEVAQKPVTVNSILSQDVVKKRFEEMLGKKSAGFMSSIISAMKSTPGLAACDPNTIIQSAVIAATLDLPIQGNLGFAYILPYKEKGVPVAQFQIGYKGLIQLCIRTGQYKTINSVEVYEGELISINKLTGAVVIDETCRTGNKIIGYVAYFCLVNGFEKYLYWSVEKVDAHAQKYSKSYNNQYGRWKLDFDVMALKTVLKMLLSKYGIMSVDMQTAQIADQAIIRNAETMDVEHVDVNANAEPTAEEKEFARLQYSIENAKTRAELEQLKEHVTEELQLLYETIYNNLKK